MQFATHLEEELMSCMSVCAPAHCCVLFCYVVITTYVLLTGGSALPDPEDIPETDLELSLEQLEK